MRGSKSDLFLKGHSTSFSSDCQRVSKNISLFLFGLVASCVFLLETGTNAWSFEERVEIPSVQGKMAGGSGSYRYQKYSAQPAFHPFEIAQLSPGRVQVLEDEPEDAKESKLQFTENKLKQAGFILPEINQVGTIIKNFSNYSFSSTGEIVYLDIGSEHGASKGKLYSIFSKTRPIRHPALKGTKRLGISDQNYKRPLAEPHPTYFYPAGKMMGHLVRPLGYLEILESTAGSSKAIIRESYTGIQNGDFVTLFEKPETPPSRPEAKGEESLEGYVIAFKQEHTMGGLNDIVYLDRGSNDKVIPGDRFEVYVTPTKIDEKWNEFDPQGVSLIPHVIAELQVLDTRKETSTGIVISSFHSIPLGASIRYKPVDIISPPLENVMALQSPPVYETAETKIPLETSQETSPEEEPFADFDPDMLANKEVEDETILAFVPTGELKDILFPFDKFDLDDISREALLKNVDYLKKHPNVHTQIQGHCDERGTNNYNLALGERRALAVKRFLSSQGIGEHRLHLISYGEEKPLCHESNPNCWRQNRRVHFMASRPDLPVN